MPVILGFLSMLWSGFAKAFAAVAGALFSFFTTKPGCYVGIAILIVAAVWYSGQRGYNNAVADDKVQQQIAQKEREIEFQAAVAAAAQIVALRQAELDKGAIAAADLAGFLRGKSQANTLTLTKEVTKYVTTQTDASFLLPCGLIRLHDASAIGIDAANLDNPSGLADDAACPVKTSDFAQIIIDNYGIDHDKDAQIIGLQALVVQYAKTISKISGDPHVVAAGGSP